VIVRAVLSHGVSGEHLVVELRRRGGWRGDQASGWRISDQEEVLLTLGSGGSTRIISLSSGGYRRKIQARHDTSHEPTDNSYQAAERNVIR